VSASVPALGAPAVRDPRAGNARFATAAFAIVGCGALAARYALVAATPRPTAALMLLFAVLLFGAVLLPLPPASHTELAPRPRPRTTTAVALLGIAAFTTARVVVGGHAPMALGGDAVATSSIAAVAEEAFFRRLCYGLLQPAGPAFAIAGSSVLFAMVHDLAAGALFGWQRLASGSWTTPAVTHVVANLLVLL
jgi:membrane protease YdiL (CAAX protease family)